MRDQLLRPSLADTPASGGLYSLHWMLLPTFFLGPFPVIVFSAFNSWRLKRPLDAIAYVLALLGMAALFYALSLRPAPEWVRQFGELIGSERPEGTLSRMYALLLWSLFYLMHRPQHRSSSMLGNAPPAWRVGIFSCVLGLVLSYGLGALLTQIHMASVAA